MANYLSDLSFVLIISSIVFGIIAFIGWLLEKTPLMEKAVKFFETLSNDEEND